MTEAQAQAKKKGISGGMLALLAAGAFKFKSLTWFAGSLLSMIASVGVFAMMFGLPYALSLVLLIYIHESGHWVWMKALGLNPKAPMFVPGLGAFVAMTKIPSQESLRAWVALAGPLVGGIGCAVMYTLGIHTHNNWLTASANTGFWLNLVQLIPAKPLDGGFVVQTISRWILIPGTILVFLAGISLGAPILIIIGIISFFSWKQPKATATPVSSSVPPAAAGDQSVSPPPDVATAGPDAGSNVSAAAAVELVPAAAWERVSLAFAYMTLICVLGFGYMLSLSEVHQFSK
jgi:Zn-dependent protease